MTYEHTRNKLSWDTTTLLIFASIGRLDRLEKLKNFAVYERSVERDLEYMIEHKRRSSPDLVRNAREVLTSLRAERLGVAFDAGSRVGLTASTYRREWERERRSSGIPSSLRQSAVLALAAALEYRGATTFSNDALREMARRDGVPMLSPTDLNMLVTCLDGDMQEGLKVQRLIADIDRGMATPRDLGDHLRLGPRIEPTKGGAHIKFGRVATVDPTKSPRQSEILLPGRTREDVPIFYPDREFFRGMLQLIQSHPDSAMLIARLTAGQLMLTSDVRADLEDDLTDQPELIDLLDMNPFAVPLDVGPYAKEIETLDAAHRSVVSAASPDGSPDASRSAASLALMAAYDNQGWTVTSDETLHTHMGEALQRAASKLPGRVDTSKRVITPPTMFEAIAQAPNLDREQLDQLREAVGRLFEHMNIAPPTTRELRRGVVAKAAHVPRFCTPALSEAEVGGEADGKTRDVLLSARLRRAEGLKSPKHNFTLTAWSNRALRAIAGVLDVQRQANWTVRLQAHVANAIERPEPRNREVPWRSSTLNWISSITDNTTARIVEAEWNSPESNSIRELIDRTSGLSSVIRRGVVVAIEEAIVRRYLERMIDGSLSNLIDSEGQLAHEDATSIDERLRLVIDQAADRETDSDAAPGIVHAERAVQRSERLLHAIVKFRARTSGQVHGFQTILRSLAATSLTPASEHSEDLRSAIDAGIEALEVDNRPSTSIAAATRRLLSDPEVNRRVLRFADTRVSAEVFLERHPEVVDVAVERDPATTLSRPRPVSPRRGRIGELSTDSSERSAGSDRAPSLLSPRGGTGIQEVDDRTMPLTAVDDHSVEQGPRDAPGELGLP